MTQEMQVLMAMSTVAYYINSDFNITQEEMKTFYEIGQKESVISLINKTKDNDLFTAALNYLKENL